MQQLQPVPTANHSRSKPHRSKDLSTCTHVFIRRDAVRRALQPPYDGPFEVLQRADKFFVVLVKGQRQTISLDRLKPAHLEPQLTSPTSQLPTTPTPQLSSSPTPLSLEVPVLVRTTRSGRRVHFPDWFTP